VGIQTGTKFTYTKTPIGATYSSFETDYDSSSNYVGRKYFYTNVNGQTYTGEEVDYDWSNKVSAVILTGVTGSPPYDKIEQDYAGGVYSGAKLYNDHVTGQSYGAEEVDVNASGVVNKVVLTGMTGTPLTSEELDYSVNGSSSTT